jgi:lysozyme
MSRLKTHARNGTAGLAALACAFIGQKEGLKLFAYRDVIGVWTACYGETKGIRAGMVFTKAECDQKFIARLDEFGDGIEKCVPSLKDEKRTPDTRYLAHLSLAYNIGLGNYCSSSVARLTRAGKDLEACQMFLKWNKAGGVVWRGLTDRRRQETDYCVRT